MWWIENQITQNVALREKNGSRNQRPIIVTLLSVTIPTLDISVTNEHQFYRQSVNEFFFLQIMNWIFTEKNILLSNNITIAYAIIQKFKNKIW